MVRFPKSLDSTESVRPDRLAIRRMLVSAAILTMIACNSVYAQTVPLAHGQLTTARQSQASIGAPAPIVTPNFQYYGGPVISDVDVVVVFWNSDVNIQVQADIGAFFQTILTTNYFSLLGEYDTDILVQQGSKSGQQGTNQIIGPGTYDKMVTITPSLCHAGSGTCALSDSEIQNELAAQIAAQKLPAPSTDNQGNVNTLYVIYFPSGITITDASGGTSCSTFCSYHYTGSISGSNVPYVVAPDLYTGPCSSGCGSGTPFQNLTATSSHELAESVTDTDVGLASPPTLDFPLGWYDTNNGEIGDPCVGKTATVSGYTVQQLWSDHAALCISAVPSFNVTAPTNATESDSFDFTVTALNSDGSANTGYTGTVHLVAKTQLPRCLLPMPSKEGTLAPIHSPRRWARQGTRS
jgi:hypothetical protein